MLNGGVNWGMGLVITNESCRANIWQQLVFQFFILLVIPSLLPVCSVYQSSHLLFFFFFFFFIYNWTRICRVSIWVKRSFMAFIHGGYILYNTFPIFVGGNFIDIFMSQLPVHVLPYASFTVNLVTYI